MYFEQLDTFLAATHFASQLSVSNLEPNVSIYITDEYADYFDYEDVGDDCDALQTSKDSTGTRKYPAAKHLTPKNNKKLKTINERTPHEDFMLAATEALRTATTSSSNKNETGADDEDLQQGKLFAMWLKKIKTPRLKRKAIQQMQEVIFRILDEDEEQQSNSQFNYSPHIYNHPPPTTNQPPPPINQPPPPINQPLPIISHHQINHHQ
ncbi:uncharacterized protein [Antedon mediterranea]|uniref:uncharacterized protein n=1 Tax=Antedon mediterranea TaxID=105859 RepID=UPI003AF4701B